MKNRYEDLIETKFENIEDKSKSYLYKQNFKMIAN